MFLLQARLVVVGVDLGETAVEQDEDHAFGPGREVGLERGGTGSGSATSSGLSLPGEEVGEGEAAHAHETAAGNLQGRGPACWRRSVEPGRRGACPTMRLLAHSI